MSSTGILAAGTLVAGRYRIEEPLAGDASGAVYRAADTRLERAVALRALSSAQAGGAAQGNLAARLVHPNVARVLDFGTDVELAADFVVADLGTGGSLAALLAQRGAPPLPMALRMVQEAAAGMAAAHRAGLVHGDLHPGVLWLSRDEGRLRVQVLGLGLNGAGTPPARATARYAAPERLRRQLALSPAADVFSLGVVAFEVFGGLPAEWNSLLLQMARGQAVVAPSLLESRPDLPAHVAHAVRRALAADPASRWPDAGDFAAQLIAEVAQQARPEPAPAVAAAPPRESAPAVFAPVAVLDAAVAATAGQDSGDDDEGSDSVTSTEAPAAASADTVAETGPVRAESAPAELPVAAEAPPADPVAKPAPAVSPAEAAPAIVGTGGARADEVTAAYVPVPAAPAAGAASEDAPARKAPRQPLTAGRTGKPIALASTDLADTLYIPPALEKPAKAQVQVPDAPPAPVVPVIPGVPIAPVDPVVPTPAPVEPPQPDAEPVPTPAPEPAVAETSLRVPAPEPAVAEASVPAPEPAAVEAPVAVPVSVSAAPAAREPEIVPEPVRAIVPESESAHAPDITPLPAIPAAAAQAKAASVDGAAADIPSLPERRRRAGMERLGPSAGNRRALMAASIAVAVLVGGGMVARTLLAGGPGPDAPEVRNVAARAAVGAGGAAPAPPQPQPAADSAPATTEPVAAAAADPARTEEEQRRELLERQRVEEERRERQRQQDSIRLAQRTPLAGAPVQAAPPAAAAPQQVAVQNVARPAAVPAPRMQAPAAAPAPAPAAADPNRVYAADELDTRPSLSNSSAFRSALDRTYPAMLRGSNTYGDAVVSFVVLPNGRVDRSSIQVLEVSLPPFRSAASAAIANARFNPARVGGVAVRTNVSMNIRWEPAARDDE